MGHYFLGAQYSAVSAVNYVRWNEGKEGGGGPDIWSNGRNKPVPPPHKSIYIGVFWANILFA